MSIFASNCDQVTVYIDVLYTGTIGQDFRVSYHLPVAGAKNLYAPLPIIAATDEEIASIGTPFYRLDVNHRAELEDQ